MGPVNGFQVGNRSIIGLHDFRIKPSTGWQYPSAQPWLKAFPDQNGHRFGTQQTPHGGFKGARIRAGHNAQQIIFRHFQYFFAFVYGFGQLSFPGADRWDRLVKAPFKLSRFHPGLLLQGPELKLGLCIRSSFLIHYQSYSSFRDLRRLFGLMFYGAGRKL